MGQLSPACGVPTSEARLRANFGPCGDVLDQIVPCCSDISSAATPTCCQSYPQPKNPCWFHSTSTTKQSERSGRSYTATAASSTQKMTGSWTRWGNLPPPRIKLWYLLTNSTPGYGHSTEKTRWFTISNIEKHTSLRHRCQRYFGCRRCRRVDRILVNHPQAPPTMKPVAISIMPTAPGQNWKSNGAGPRT